MSGSLDRTQLCQSSLFSQTDTIKDLTRVAGCDQAVNIKQRKRTVTCSSNSHPKVEANIPEIFYNQVATNGDGDTSLAKLNAESFDVQMSCAVQMSRHVSEAVRKKHSQVDSLNVCPGDETDLLRDHLHTVSLCSVMKECQDGGIVIRQGHRSNLPSRHHRSIQTQAANIPESVSNMLELDHRELADVMMDKENSVCKQTIDCCQEQKLWQKHLDIRVSHEIYGRHVEARSPTSVRLIEARSSTSGQHIESMSPTNVVSISQKKYQHIEAGSQNNSQQIEVRPPINYQHDEAESPTKATDASTWCLIECNANDHASSHEGISSPAILKQVSSPHTASHDCCHQTDTITAKSQSPDTASYEGCHQQGKITAKSHNELELIRYNIFVSNEVHQERYIKECREKLESDKLNFSTYVDCNQLARQTQFMCEREDDSFVKRYWRRILDREYCKRRNIVKTQIPGSNVSKVIDVNLHSQVRHNITTQSVRVDTTNKKLNNENVSIVASKNYIEKSHSNKLTNSVERCNIVEGFKEKHLHPTKYLLQTEIRSQPPHKVNAWRRTNRSKLAITRKCMGCLSRGAKRVRKVRRSYHAVSHRNKLAVVRESRHIGMSRQSLSYLAIEGTHGQKLSENHTESCNVLSSRVNKASLCSCSLPNLKTSYCNIINEADNSTLLTCQPNKHLDLYSGFKQSEEDSVYDYVVRTKKLKNTDDKYSRKICIHTKYVQPGYKCRLSMKKMGHFSGRLQLISRRCLQHKLLPSYFLNVNSNAGISETGSDGAKIETKQPSCTSVHSSDQYYSTHTDTPDGKVTDSDMEASPSFSSTEDVAVNAHGGSDLVSSKSCEQNKQGVDDLEGKRQNMKASGSETGKVKRLRKNAEEANTDDCADLRVMKHGSTNQTSIAGTQEEAHAQAANKHKRKTKTTETLYIKFESSMSKKVTTTTLVKDGRKPAITKPRTEQQKLLPLADDVQKEATSGSEKFIENPRYTKIIRCTEGPYDNSDNPLKGYTEALAEPAPTEESFQTTVQQNQEERVTEMDHRSSHTKIFPIANCKQDNQGQVKQQYSMLERLTSQRSPHKTHSPPSSLETKADIVDSDYASEKESSAATIVNTSNVSSAKEINILKETKDHSTKNDLIPRTDKHKRSDSPKKDSKNIAEKKEQLKQLTPAQKDCSVKKEEDQTRNEILYVTGNELSSLVSSTSSDVNAAGNSVTRQKVDSPLKKSPVDSTVKSDTKKVATTKGKSKPADDLTIKDDSIEPSKGKSAMAIKKKSPTRIKTPSRSPDYKRRKRSAKKSTESKSSNSIDSSKSDKSRKQKLSDKMVDKKKKKKKQKQKGAEKVDEDTSETALSTKKGLQLPRSRSSDASKTTQTLSCSVSAPQFLEATLLADQISPLNHWKEQESNIILMSEKQNSGMEVRSLDRENATQSREVKVKSRGAASVENVSTCPVPNKPIRAAESVPTFTGTVYTTLTKVVQVTSCPKLKRSEKDLQKAELGWNSSTLSAEEKAAAEKAKQNQKRAKARYYLAKPKLKRSFCEAGSSKLKRSAPRRSQADGDTSDREVSVKDDLAQQERTRPGQGKSVQFSDSTEDHEAFKDDIVGEKTVPYEISDDNDAAQQVASKSCNDTLKQLNKLDAEVLVPSKLSGQKKDETRSQTTPPRKKRLIWLKKRPKDKCTINAKSNAIAKSVSALVPSKQLQTSENTTKPSSRFNIHLYYPVKQKLESPTLSNISLDDKKTVAYNTWINGTILTAPMNKATRKMVAKTGSPVDIKEIIEGSSVDAADYYRTMKSMHDLGVRAAKSVPSLGPQRTAGMDMISSRRVKLQGESRVTPQKKNKDIKVQESGSARSLSSTDGTDDQGVSVKIRSGGIDASISPASSTDIDIAGGFKHKIGHSRFLGQSHFRKDKKNSKKSSQDGSNKWHIVNAQDVHSAPDLTRVQYYGDMMEFNALNMGFTWMVQSVFSRFPFLNQRSSSAANASGDRPVSQQADE